MDERAPLTVPGAGRGGTVGLESNSSAETERIGAGLTDALHGGDVVLIEGELGAGKTTLVRGACRALGVTAPVTSPTFTIGQRYPAPGGPVRFVSHLDLYRIADLGSEDPDLLADYIAPDCIAFVEWSDGAGPAIAAFGRIAATVTIRHAGGDARKIEVTRP